MKLKTGIALFFVLVAIGFWGWHATGDFKPSRDGLFEEAVALNGMQRYCMVTKLSCKTLHLEERFAPVEENGEGHWKFVFRVDDAGPRYSIAVTPGIETQVIQLD